MIRVPVRELVPGQRTAAPVTGVGGVMLIQAATELTESLIARLSDLGVDTVWVLGAPGEGAATARRVAEVDARFRGHEANRWMMDLKAIVVRQITGEDEGAS